MARVRSRLSAVLTVGAGFVGYHYIYRSKHREPVQIYDGITVDQPWQVRLYMHLPLNAASRVWGRVNDIELPVWAREPVCKLYISLFCCNMSEAAITDLRRYENLGEFFRRQLRPGCRPVDQKCLLTCPSDGIVMTCGKVTSDHVEQVKGVTYLLSRFLGPADWPHVDVGSADNKSLAVSNKDYSLQSKTSSKDTQLYQAVIYLAPGDYHRFHSPTEWSIIFRRYFPGLLLSVNPHFAHHIPGLLSLNERVIYIGKWQYGFMALSAVGATNVGSIRVYHDPSLHTNISHPTEAHSDRVYQLSDSTQPVDFKRGEAFGEFNLGSTMVLLFEAPKNFRFSISPGQRVKYGQVVGR